VKKRCAEETNARNDQAFEEQGESTAKRETPVGFASEELARTRAKELLEVKLAMLDNLRGKRRHDMSRVWVGHVPVV
jgi:hypothetical protein